MPTDEWLDCLQTTNQYKQCTPYDRGTREMHVGIRSKRTREREREKEIASETARVNKRQKAEEKDEGKGKEKGTRKER